MPKYTLDLSAAAVQKLQAIVARHNADTGEALTVQDWLILHVKELTIADALAAKANDLQQQAQRDLGAAVAAERQRLIDAL